MPTLVQLTTTHAQHIAPAKPLSLPCADAPQQAPMCSPAPEEYLITAQVPPVPASSAPASRPSSAGAAVASGLSSGSAMWAMSSS